MIEEREPDFINEKGTKFWKDLDVMKYIKSLGLKDIFPYIIEDAKNNRTRVLIKNNNYIYENPNVEAIATRLDMLKLLEEK